MLFTKGDERAITSDKRYLRDAYDDLRMTDVAKEIEERGFFVKDDTCSWAVTWHDLAACRRFGKQARLHVPSLKLRAAKLSMAVAIL